MSRGTILVVDDDQGDCKALAEIISSAGYAVETSGDGSKALEALNHFSPDLVLTDLSMPSVGGMELLRELRKRSARMPVVVMTARGGIDGAVAAMHDGAADYLIKPLDADGLLMVLENALERTRSDSLPPKSDIRELRLDNIVGTSPEMRLVFRQVAQIAPSRATILLTGESGTGKEMVVAAIHNRSERASGPLVSVHCGALSDGLLESELFGHERGSFTGAAKQRRGRFEQADGGTLFLDEIGEISLATQAKLLRVLQEREFERVGGNETIHVDVRLVTATNRDLKEMVAKGTFREDLYYRLNVINVHLPPLRERASDIPALAEHFLGIFVADNETAARRFSADALTCLVRYRWPGNVRELENVVQRAVVLADGELIEPQHLPSEVAMTPRCDVIPSIPGATMLDFERYAIQKAIEVTGSARNAAKALGISVRKVQYRLQEYRMVSGDDAPTDPELPATRPRRIGFRSRS